MKRFLALVLGALTLVGLPGCKQLGCDKPAPAAAPSEPAVSESASESVPEAAPESNNDNKPA